MTLATSFIHTLLATNLTIKNDIGIDRSRSHKMSQIDDDTRAGLMAIGAMLGQQTLHELGTEQNTPTVGSCSQVNGWFIGCTNQTGCAIFIQKYSVGLTDMASGDVDFRIIAKYA